MAIQTSVENGLGRLVLNQPPLNILTRDLLAKLRGELERLAAEPSLRVLLLSAEGKHFSAGADVGEHLPPTYEEMIPEFVDTIAAIDAFPLPVLAVVQGRCLGGGFELAMAADVIIAGEGASFGQPEILLGVLPPAACALLPDICPPGVAAQIVFTGDPLSAGDALRAGIVTRVVPDTELETVSLELAGRITRHSAAALRLAKRMLRGGRQDARAAALSRAGAIYLGELMKTKDALEGLNAFLEKRQPTWSHE
ncbi:MAG: enoyl-CoA hydratase/isomerase family protein [Gemmatimonadota bacterium]|nr:MAG: enoyl-CoA hydratase/isomerase family protein [Gemmatimonadota bacterium]